MLRSLILSAILLPLVSVTSGCMLMNQILDPRPVGAPNIELENGMSWRQVQSLDLSGIWLDEFGSRIRVDWMNGTGRATVESGGLKFFWTDGDMVVKADTVTLDRRLGGDRVDRPVGQLVFAKRFRSGSYPELMIDFGERGRWIKDKPCKLLPEWLHNGTPIRVEHDGGKCSYFWFTEDPSLGWTKARAELTGPDVTVWLWTTAGGDSQAVKGKFVVGLPQVSDQLQAFVDGGKSQP